MSFLSELSGTSLLWWLTEYVSAIFSTSKTFCLIAHYRVFVEFTFQCITALRLSNLVSILPLKPHLCFHCSIRSRNISNECIQQQNWSQYCVSHFWWRVWRVKEKCSFTYQMKWVSENQPFQPHTDFSTLYWSIGC